MDDGDGVDGVGVEDGVDWAVIGGWHCELLIGSAKPDTIAADGNDDDRDEEQDDDVDDDDDDDDVGCDDVNGAGAFGGCGNRADRLCL